MFSAKRGWVPRGYPKPPRAGCVVGSGEFRLRVVRIRTSAIIPFVAKSPFQHAGYGCRG